MCVCIHGGALVIAGDGPCPSLYRLHVLASPQPATNACVLLSVMSRPAGHDPPHCKPKQMSDEGKGLVLHNGGARHYVSAEEFEEIH